MAERRTYSVISHESVVRMFLLLELVSEVNSEVRAGSIVGGTAEPHIAICIQHHIGHGCYYQ